MISLIPEKKWTRCQGYPSDLPKTGILSICNVFFAYALKPSFLVSGLICLTRYRFLKGNTPFYTLWGAVCHFAGCSALLARLFHPFTC